jgi:glycosyltransferase involved in cell wall biosynthesis
VQQALLRRGLRAVSVVVANSAGTRAVLESVGMRVDSVIWNGVPPFDARPPLQGPPMAMVAGRLVREKGVDVLLRAMPAVRARIPGARLRIAGEGPERPALERMSRELGLDAAVEFVGHLPHARMESLAGEAWVQVVPSRWDEPFGIVAAEAMMRGTAVVASDCGGLSEIVHEELTGLRVPPGDVGRLADALVRLLSDRSLAERLGEAGRTFALAELTLAGMVDRFLDLYASLLDRTPLAHVRG